MAYLPDARDPQDPNRREADGSTHWILGAVVVVLLLVAAWAYIAAEGEQMSAMNKTPDAQRLLDEPSPVPPGERERRKSEPI